MNRPNFFIIGAPKCGTTALASYLRDHPNVFMPDEKEPHYFANDLWQFHDYYTKSESDYLSLFDEATSDHQAIGEASVFYAFSHDALHNIRQFNPNARLIMMVRNPIDLVYSLHAQYVYNGFDETEPNFEQAWALQEERANGNRLPPKYQDVTDRSREMVQYGEIGRLGKQVARLFNTFPASQIKIIVFDDFKADTAAVYHDVLRFLSLPSDGRINFERINANTERRAAIMRHAMKRLTTNKTAIRYWRRVKKLFGFQSLGMMDKVDRVTTMEVKREPLSAETRRQLKRFFQSDIDHLGAQIGRDLSHWR